MNTNRKATRWIAGLTATAALALTLVASPAQADQSTAPGQNKDMTSSKDTGWGP